MKEERNETISPTQDIIIETIQDEPSTTKVTECPDEVNNNGNNNDAGYMTSSSHSSNAETPEDESWRLSLPPKLNHLTDEDIQKIFIESKATVDNLPEEERRQWLLDRFTEHYGNVMPRSLIELTVAHYFDGDSGIDMDVKPDWLDIDKFRRGQQFAKDYMFAISYADLLSLFTVFAFEDGLKPLILTDASSTPYTAFKRYLSTGSRVRSWYTSDPWTAGTPAYNDVRAVRRMHAMVRKKIRDMPGDVYNEKTKIKDAWCPALNRSRRDLESTCPAPKPGQCPYRAMGSIPDTKNHKLSQGEMAATQFAFVGLVILYPKFFGMHDATDEDLENFCYVWRGLGYLLGVDDDSNFCRGSLEDVRTRTRDFLEYWVKPEFRDVNPEWEHMMRCVIEGMQYYFPGSTYETCLLDLAEIMNLHMPRTYGAMSYSMWIKHNIIRFYFNHGSKLSFLRERMNHRLNAAIERALNFDERKHRELKERSAKMLDSYITETKCK